MNTDPASLQNLKDIFLPPEVSWWPPAIGWWFLLGCVLLVWLYRLARTIKKWRANAYRRAAFRDVHLATSISEISVILKRTALAAFPRSEVASLSGQRWCDWLAMQSPVPVSGVVRKALSESHFRKIDHEDPQILRELANFATQWIQCHEPSNKPSSEQTSC